MRLNLPRCQAIGIYLCQVLLFLGFFLFPFSGWAKQFICPESEVNVTGGGPAEREWVCTAARKAIPFFRLNGLELPQGLTVILTDSLPGNGDQHALGQYDARSNRIRLLTYEQALRLSRKDPPPFGIPLSPELWRSYVVHELAHAAAEKAFAPGVEKFTASEYIAAATQFASLSQATRERILRHFPDLSGFEEPTQITGLYYLFAPGKFAINAYLHYSRPENGPRFIKRLLREGLSSPHLSSSGRHRGTERSSPDRTGPSSVGTEGFRH